MSALLRINFEIDKIQICNNNNMIWSVATFYPTFCRYTQSKTTNQNKKPQSCLQRLARHTPLTLFC